MSKVIAIMDKPKDCQSCVFGICKYSTPLSTGRKGYYCQLKELQNRVVEHFGYDGDVHLHDCPLRPVPEKKAKYSLMGDGSAGRVDGWIPCSEMLPEVPEGVDDVECPEFNVTINGAEEATTLKCSFDGTWFDDSGNLYEVVAWQPLPEPFKRS